MIGSHHTKAPDSERAEISDVGVARAREHEIRCFGELRKTQRRQLGKSSGAAPDGQVKL
ncbi:MAG: hypothetical protein WCB11_13200 [Terriglobales bacterium]